MMLQTADIAKLLSNHPFYRLPYLEACTPEDDIAFTARHHADMIQLYINVCATIPTTGHSCVFQALTGDLSESVRVAYENSLKRLLQFSDRYDLDAGMLVSLTLSN